MSARLRSPPAISEKAYFLFKLKTTKLCILFNKLKQNKIAITKTVNGFFKQVSFYSWNFCLQSSIKIKLHQLRKIPITKIIKLNYMFIQANRSHQETHSSLLLCKNRNSGPCTTFTLTSIYLYDLVYTIYSATIKAGFNLQYTVNKHRI